MTNKGVGEASTPVDSGTAALKERLDALILDNDAKFPHVTHVTAQYVFSLPHPTFVDCRSAAERAVSIIPGAVGIDAFDVLLPKPGGVVVCYCTIGYRSSLHAARLESLIGERPIPPYATSLLPISPHRF